MVGSQRLISLLEMRYVILNRNQTTWGSKDTRLAPKAFYEPTLKQQIDISEMGGFHFGIDIVNPSASHGEKFGGKSENFRFVSR